jgi:hypothetical protein
VIKFIVLQLLGFEKLLKVVSWNARKCMHFMYFPKPLWTTMEAFYDVL